jgi:hypothetical protein
MKVAVLGLLVCGFTTAVQAQDMNSFLELLRKDLKTEKSAVITAAMDFTEAESEVFWPIYREYENEVTKLWDVRIGIIRDYANTYETMTDEIAKDLVNRSFKVREQFLKLDQKYWKKFAKELSPIQAGRFWQVNSQINDLLDLQVASELPLVEAPASMD